MKIWTILKIETDTSPSRDRRQSPEPLSSTGKVVWKSGVSATGPLKHRSVYAVYHKHKLCVWNNSRTLLPQRNLFGLFCYCPFVFGFFNFNFPIRSSENNKGQAGDFFLTSCPNNSGGPLIASDTTVKGRSKIKWRSYQQFVFPEDCLNK